MSANRSSGAQQHVSESASKTTSKQHQSTDSSSNEIMQRFSVNLRRMIENRENLAAKSVTFSTATVETSFGGTQTPGRIKDSSVLSDSGQQVINRSNVKPLISKPMYVKASVSKQACRDQSPRRASENVIRDKTTVGVKSETVLSADSCVTPLRRHTMERLRDRVSSTPECFKPVTLETPRTKQQRRSVDILGDDSTDSSMTVAVRVRPLHKR